MTVRHGTPSTRGHTEAHSGLTSCGSKFVELVCRRRVPPSPQHAAGGAARDGRGSGPQPKHRRRRFQNPSPLSKGRRFEVCRSKKRSPPRSRQAKRQDRKHGGDTGRRHVSRQPVSGGHSSASRSPITGRCDCNSKGWPEATPYRRSCRPADAVSSFRVLATGRDTRSRSRGCRPVYANRRRVRVAGRGPPVRPSQSVVITSTLLTLLVIPTVYEILDGVPALVQSAPRQSSGLTIGQTWTPDAWIAAANARAPVLRRTA